LSKLKAADERETSGWRLIPVTRPWLVESLTCAARFLKYDGRSKNWVAVDAPDRVADAYLNRQGTWKLPILTRITNSPFLRGDGRGRGPREPADPHPHHHLTVLARRRLGLRATRL